MSVEDLTRGKEVQFIVLQKGQWMCQTWRILWMRSTRIKLVKKYKCRMVNAMKIMIMTNDHLKDTCNIYFFDNSFLKQIRKKNRPFQTDYHQCNAEFRKNWIWFADGGHGIDTVRCNAILIFDVTILKLYACMGTYFFITKSYKSLYDCQ